MAQLVEMTVEDLQARLNLALVGACGDSKWCSLGLGFRV